MRIQRVPASSCYLPLVLILAAGSLLVAGRLCADDGNSRIAQLYLTSALALFEADDAEGAVELALRAMEFDPDSADGHALLAVAAEAAGRRGDAIDHFLPALASPDLGILGRRTLVDACARCLIQTRRPMDALTLLDHHRGSGDESAGTHRVRIQALLALGRVPAALTAAEAALVVYPSDPELYAMAARVAAELSNLGEARRFIDIGLHIAPESASLFLALAEMTGDPAERAAALKSYWARGGTDPLSAVLALGTDVTGGRSQVIRFFSLDGGGRSDLIDRVLEAVRDDEEALGEARTRLAAYSGIAVADFDGDGAAEEEYTLSGGRVVRWRRDADQNGRPEIEIAFDESGAPVAFWAPAGLAPGEHFLAVSVHVVYAGYPSVSTVEYTTGAVARNYELIPAALVVPLTAPRRQPAISLRLSQGFLVPAEEDVRRLSHGATERTLPDRIVASRYRLVDGVVVHVWGDSNLNGVADHELSLRGGRVVAGRRDLDEDGTYETEETYGPGGLEALRIDTDGDGRVDYLYETDLRRGAWDLDGDGFLDVRRYIVNGTIIMEQVNEATWQEEK